MREEEESNNDLRILLKYPSPSWNETVQEYTYHSFDTLLISIYRVTRFSEGIVQFRKVSYRISSMKSYNIHHFEVIDIMSFHLIVK